MHKLSENWRGLGRAGCSLYWVSVAKFWLQEWPLGELSRSCSTMGTAGSRQLQQTQHSTQLSAAATLMAPVGKHCWQRAKHWWERAVRGKRSSRNSLANASGWQECGRGMLKTAELSFLSLWERAKCSRYLSAVCGEGCVGADTPYSPCRAQRTPHCSRWVFPCKELQPMESLCWSRALPGQSPELEQALLKGTAAHREPPLEPVYPEWLQPTGRTCWSWGKAWGARRSREGLLQVNHL